MSLWKGSSETFIKTQLHCVFRDKIISYVIKICLFQILSNKISIALILKCKSCICCQKLCRVYFRRHMECAVLKRFLKVQGTFSIKKFLQNPLSHLEKIKFNPFRSTSSLSGTALNLSTAHWQLTAKFIICRKKAFSKEKAFFYFQYDVMSIPCFLSVV